MLHLSSTTNAASGINELIHKLKLRWIQLLLTLYQAPCREWTALCLAHCYRRESSCCSLRRTTAKQETNVREFLRFPSHMSYTNNQCLFNAKLDKLTNIM